MEILTANTAAVRLMEQNAKFEGLLKSALRNEHMDTVHRIRIEVMKKANRGQDMSTVYPILDAEGERYDDAG